MRRTSTELWLLRTSTSTQMFFQPYRPGSRSIWCWPRLSPHTDLRWSSKPSLLTEHLQETRKLAFPSKSSWPPTFQATKQSRLHSAVTNFMKTFLPTYIWIWFRWLFPPNRWYSKYAAHSAKFQTQGCARTAARKLISSLLRRLFATAWFSGGFSPTR